MSLEEALHLDQLTGVLTVICIILEVAFTLLKPTTNLAEVGV